MSMDEKRWIDLRSDTVTVPSREMLLTVLEAQLGDDGRRITPETGGDGTVNELEALAARITGKEAAILFPSGTMANTAALLTWAKARGYGAGGPSYALISSGKNRLCTCAWGAAAGVL